MEIAKQTQRADAPTRGTGRTQEERLTTANLVRFDDADAAAIILADCQLAGCTCVNGLEAHFGLATIDIQSHFVRGRHRKPPIWATEGVVDVTATSAALPVAISGRAVVCPC